jgi:hypothetical protein
LIAQLLQIKSLRQRSKAKHQNQPHHEPVAAAEPARLRSATKSS